MIRLLSFLSLFQCLVMAEIEISGHFDLESQVYLTQGDAKHGSSFTAKQTLEFSYALDEWNVYAKLYAQESYHDFLQTQDETKRSFTRLDELYLRYDAGDFTLQIGKSIKFWGALELRNIVDVFNPNELRNDVFNTDRLGVWNASYSYYTDSGEISLIVKGIEPKQKMPRFPYAYYVFPNLVTYNDALQTSKNVNTPSFYLSYSGTTDTRHALDYAFIYEHGYDSQRYFSQVLNQPTVYVQNAYQVDKFMTYNTLVVGSTLFKLEALYAKVADDEFISDYSHLAVGVEYALDDFEDGTSLSIITEYYKYTTYEDEKYSDLQLFETMQDDIFAGVRYVLNNADDTKIVGGVIHDLEYNEQTFYAEFGSRVGDSFKVSFDYYYIEPSTKELTANTLLGRHQRVGLNLAYYY